MLGNLASETYMCKKIVRGIAWPPLEASSLQPLRPIIASVTISFCCLSSAMMRPPLSPVDSRGGVVELHFVYVCWPTGESERHIVVGGLCVFVVCAESVERKD